MACGCLWQALQRGCGHAIVTSKTFPRLRPIVIQYMGGCQNHDPFSCTLNTRCRIVIVPYCNRDPKGTIILTTTHMQDRAIYGGGPQEVVHAPFSPKAHASYEPPTRCALKWVALKRPRKVLLNEVHCKTVRDRRCHLVKGIGTTAV